MKGIECDFFDSNFTINIFHFHTKWICPSCNPFIYFNLFKQIFTLAIYIPIYVKSPSK